MLYRQSYAAESIAHSMLPGLVVASLVAIPLGIGAAAGLAVAAACVAAASRQHAVERRRRRRGDGHRAVRAGTLLALSPEVPVRLGEILFGDPLGVSTGDLVASAAARRSSPSLALARGHRSLSLSGVRPADRARASAAATAARRPCCSRCWR